MDKLYEAIAIEPELKIKAGEELKRLATAFKGGAEFIGQEVRYHPIDEDGEELPGETVELVTTVSNELTQFARIFGEYVNVSLEKEQSNMGTKGTVAIGDLTFELSAPALLNLENKLEDIRRLYLNIPVLDATEKWEFSESEGVYITAPRLQFKTKKVMQAFVAYEATPEHAAQVETYREDVPTHTRETIITSGEITTSDKRARIARIDELIKAVKKARHRANDTDAVEVNLADQIFAYINQE